MVVLGCDYVMLSQQGGIFALGLQLVPCANECKERHVKQKSLRQRGVDGGQLRTRKLHDAAHTDRHALRYLQHQVINEQLQAVNGGGHEQHDGEIKQTCGSGDNYKITQKKIGRDAAKIVEH